MAYFLAFYIGKKKIEKGFKPKVRSMVERGFDGLIRLVTQSRISHVEVVEQLDDGLFSCWSSSLRDGGIRNKKIDLTPDKWLLVPLSQWTHSKCVQWFIQKNGLKYDLCGAIASVIPFIESKDKYFCSEAVAASLGIHQAWRINPATLHQIALSGFYDD